MKVGVNTATALKEKSMSLSIPFANLLRGYLIEDVLERIYQSDYKEVLWLVSDHAIGLEQYKSSKEDRLEFYYLESEKSIPQEKLIPGQKLSEEMACHMLGELFLNEHLRGIYWEGTLEERYDCYEWKLTGVFCEMQVPLAVRLRRLSGKNLRPEKREFSLFMESQKPLLLYTYSPENRLSEHFFEIMKKLELIADMESYDVVDQILKTQSVSGRHIMEELGTRVEKEPRVLRIQRITQVEEYREYTYMRKRWEQYLKRSNQPQEAWSEVLDRFISFAKPIWTALCQNEIFFDDWMPELGRFLG